VIAGKEKITPDDLPGGAIKDNAIKGKTYTKPDWMKGDNTDLVDCTFTGEALHSDQIGKNIRLFNPTFKDLKPFSIGGSGSTFGFYINMGKRGELRHGFVIYGGKVIGLKAVEFMESKAIDPWVVYLDFSESPNIERGIRVRHGAYANIYGCKKLKRVTLRGHHHSVVECPETQVDFLAGDLSGQWKDWIEERPPGDGPREGSYQRAEYCYAEGVKIVNVGAKMQAKTPKKAYKCMAAPGQPYELLEQEGFKEMNLNSVEELAAVW
jgi:hypothetical protein